MKFLLNIFIIALLLIVAAPEIHGQELVYDVNISGKYVGNMMVTKKELSEDKTYYSAITDVEYTLFAKTELVYLYEAIFKNSMLEMSYFIHKKNGATVEEAKLERKGPNSYVANKDEEAKTLKGNINKSMLKLYFETPEKRDSVFSERFHQYVQIAKLPDENRYMLDIPNGDKNIYSYNESGICTRINITSSLLKFEMSLRTEEESEE